MNPWIVALVVSVAGVVLASILAPIVRKVVAKSEHDSVKELAPVAGTFVFWLLIALGVLFGVGQTSPENITPLPGKLINFFPKVLVAGVMIMAGTVVSQIVSLGVGRAILKSSGARKPAIEKLVGSTILALFGLLAIGQIGINTTIVNMLVAAVVFGVALSSALLVGFGGRDVARHLAAGRYLRSVVAPGAIVQAAGVTGTVVALHPASMELQVADGSSVHVPNGTLLGEPVRILQPAPLEPNI
jgi:Mechanosensitive ion channel